MEALACGVQTRGDRSEVRCARRPAPTRKRAAEVMGPNELGNRRAAGGVRETENMNRRVRVHRRVRPQMHVYADTIRQGA